MVSVTGSVTWISHSPSVIGLNPNPRRQTDERHAHRHRLVRTIEAVRPPARRRKVDAYPLLGTAAKGRSNSLTGMERGPYALEAGAYEVENNVRGEFCKHGFSDVQDVLRALRVFPSMAGSSVPTGLAFSN